MNGIANPADSERVRLRPKALGLGVRTGVAWIVVALPAWRFVGAAYFALGPVLIGGKGFPLVEESGCDRPFGYLAPVSGRNGFLAILLLKQVNKANVTKLEVAWTYPVGLETCCSIPTLLDGTTYVVSTQNKICAGRGHRQRNLSWSQHWRSGFPRYKLLGKQRPLGPSPVLYQCRLPDGA